MTLFFLPADTGTQISTASGVPEIRTVAVLFARVDSVYKAMPGCDVYDIERDARTWPGGMPIVAHPPCRAWGSLAFLAKPRPGERELAIWAVDQIRLNGGVLEHPERSKLWPEYGLPEPGSRDRFGGWTLPVLQNWWGHKAEKATRFYIVGIEPGDIPAIPLSLEYATHVVTKAPRRKDGTRKRAGEAGYRPELSKKAREATPPRLAEWLVEVARRSSVMDREPFFLAAHAGMEISRAGGFAAAGAE